MTTAPLAPTLYARLACACNCAYGIDAATGKYTPPAIYGPGVGWQQTPTPFSAQSFFQNPANPRINACLVGLSVDGIVIAMRGTLPPSWTVASLEDWWQDIVDAEPIVAPPLQGKVHEGFWHALQTLWAGVAGEIRRLHQQNPGTPVYFTGHSKGAPLASIGAALLSESERIGVKEVVTFASPHPGNGDFATHYPGSIPVTRFENYLDLVPFLPPTNEFYQDFHQLLPAWVRTEFCSWFPSICKALDHASQWDYEPLGTLHFVTANGTVVNQQNPDANAYLRLGQILAVLLGFSAETDITEAVKTQQQLTASSSGVARIGAAHCIACKSSAPGVCAGGYMTGAGGNPVCPQVQG